MLRLIKTPTQIKLTKTIPKNFLQFKTANKFPYSFSFPKNIIFDHSKRFIIIDINCAQAKDSSRKST